MKKVFVFQDTNNNDSRYCFIYYIEGYFMYLYKNEFYKCNGIGELLCRKHFKLLDRPDSIMEEKINKELETYLTNEKNP